MVECVDHGLEHFLQVVTFDTKRETEGVGTKLLLKMLNIRKMKWQHVYNKMVF